MTTHDLEAAAASRAPADTHDAADADGAVDGDVVGVLLAARRLVDAFAGGDLDAYFTSFTPDASFVFHSHSERIDSTAAYRAVWDEWVAQDGFRVLEVSSYEPSVQALGAGVAVFTHRVRTVIATHAGQHTLHERETIVFVRGANGHWLGAHEHLSVDPTHTAVTTDTSASGSYEGSDTDRQVAAPRG